ncbi:MAG: adenylate/guanylate cyclase domain-containing protein, partial [Pseudomonadota bacterium]
LVAFNAPLDNPEHGASGLAAARDLLEMAETRDFAGERLAIRIGVASGPVAAGTVGGQGRRAYTLYGDTVNHAQRLEAQNKETGTRLLADADTWSRAGKPQGFHPLPPMHLRGREVTSEVVSLA